jgi:hypothetical protein
MSKQDDQFWEPIKAVGLLFLVVGGIIANIASLLLSFVREGVFNLRAAADNHTNARRRSEEERQLKVPLVDVRSLARTLEVRVAAANLPNRNQLFEALADRLMNYSLSKYEDKVPAKPILQAVFDAAWELLQLEKPVIPTLSSDQIELARQTDYLLAQVKKFEQPEKMLDAFYEAVVSLFVLLSNDLP